MKKAKLLWAFLLLSPIGIGAMENDGEAPSGPNETQSERPLEQKAAAVREFLVDITRPSERGIVRDQPTFTPALTEEGSKYFRIVSDKNHTTIESYTPSPVDEQQLKAQGARESRTKHIAWGAAGGAALIGAVWLAKSWLCSSPSASSCS